MSLNPSDQIRTNIVCILSDSVATEPLRFRGTRDHGTIHVAYCENTTEKEGKRPLDIIEKYMSM